MWPLLHHPMTVGVLSEQYCKAIPKPDVFHRRHQKMEPEAISPFLQPLPFSHRHLTKLPRRLPLHLIVCRSGQSEPDGSGPASPIRGQLNVVEMWVLQKKKHHQLRNLICRRCELLSHGHMITAVGGNGGYRGGKQFVTAEELRENLSYLRREKALNVKLVEIVDFNGGFLSRIRDIVGANPIILVVTKVDLLPNGTDFSCIGDWIVESTVKKKLNVTSVHLTSAKMLE